MKLFQDWVEEFGGAEELASRLGTTSSAVRVWLTRKGYPRVQMMKKLIIISRGVLSYETIIESTKPRGTK